MSNTLNFEITQGDTMVDQVAISNRLTDAAPVPDLITVEFLVKNSLTDADLASVLARHTDTAAELVIDDADLWTCSIKATSAETAALTAGRYKCVCTTEDANGNTSEAFRGSFVVHPRGSDPS